MTKDLKEVPKSMKLNFSKQSSFSKVLYFKAYSEGNNGATFALTIQVCDVSVSKETYSYVDTKDNTNGS